MNYPDTYSHEEQLEMDRLYDVLLDAWSGKKTDDDIEQVRKAYEFAALAHKDARRKSGEPYIFHPIAVAIVAVFIYTSPSLNPLFPFMHAWQYAMIVLGMMIINLYISRKYNKKMFKESVRKTLRGGAKE